MKLRITALLGVMPVLLLLMLTGCATIQHESRSFEPPSSYRAETDGDETAPQSVSDLLREADDEFQAANEAEEKGDHDAALGHYNRMLELLSKADLDPSVYYSLRNEFARILGRSSEGEELVPKWKEGTVAVDLPIPSPVPERVQREIEKIQTGYPRNFQAGLDRAQKYLPYIKTEFKKAGLPEDLAYLAMVESQFSPKIDSRAGAGGMWQFMRATGSRYGLRNDRYLDERYDWKKATGAAIAYLQTLYTMFGGDWPLAISAYNMGEYGLERAILASGGEHDLWRLMETSPADRMMQEETKCFYAKLLASIIVANDPERYGFTINAQDPEQTVTAQVSNSYSLAALDKACGLHPGTLQRLNPQFVRGITPPSGECVVSVPVDHHQDFLAALKRSDVRYTAASHTVRRGETVSAIASRYHVSADELMRVNKISSPRSLRIGKHLVIPGVDGATVAEADTQSESAAATVVAASAVTVHSGDTLHDIAVANNVTVEDLQKWNNLGDSTLLHPGDELKLKAAAAKSDQVNVGYYTVKAGDYPGKIAQANGMTLDELYAWNGMKKGDVIVAGHKLRVRDNGGMQAVDQTPAVAAASDVAKITHTVARGDTPSTIAQKYHVSLTDFLKWNNLTRRSVIKVGDQCVVYTEKDTTMTLASVTPDNGSAKTTVHVVSRGQSPWTIAQKYGVSVDDLAKWNHWRKNPVLRVGDKVVIQK